MNQDTANKIILALLAINTAMMIYCCIKRLSEEFQQRVEKKSTTTAVATATQAPAKPAAPAPAKAAAPAATSQPAVAVPLPRSGRGNKL